MSTSFSDNGSPGTATTIYQIAAAQDDRSRHYYFEIYHSGSADRPRYQSRAIYPSAHSAVRDATRIFDAIFAAMAP